MPDITCVKSIKIPQLMFFWLIKLEVFTTLPLLSLAWVIVTKWYSFFRAYFKTLLHKNIEYWNFKTFTKMISSMSVILNLVKELLMNISNQYDIFTYIFRMVLDKHASIHSKKIRGNQVPLMSKELSKAIMNRFKFRNNYTNLSRNKITFAIT